MKLVGKQMSNQTQQTIEKMRVVTTFWKEFDLFHNKLDMFSEPHIWADPQRDDAPHLWHRIHSLPYTKVLGQVGCIVCSKILGQGASERSWGSVKDITDGKRTSISNRALMMQVSCYGAYCNERADLQRASDENLNIEWTDDDFEALGLDKFLVDVNEITGEKPRKVIFRAWIEDWEKEALTTKSTVNEVMLRRKYGNKKYYNCDNGGFEARVIDINRLKWSNKKSDPGASVFGRLVGSPTDDTDDVEQWMIDEDLHFCIRCYYKHNPQEGVTVVTYEEWKQIGLPDDEAMIDEWIENGGRFPPVKPKARAPKKSTKRSSLQSKHRSRSVGSQKVSRSNSHDSPSKNTRSKRAVLDQSGSSSSEEEEEPRPRSKKRTFKHGGTVDMMNEKSDSDSDSSTTVGGKP